MIVQVDLAGTMKECASCDASADNKDSLKKKTVREFVRFYIEKSKTDLVKQIGYVPVTDKTAKQNLDKLEKVVSEVTGSN